MDKGIFATVEHRKLMELKNCVPRPPRMEYLADLVFLNLKDQIKAVRGDRKSGGFFSRLFSFDMPINQEVDLMFPERKDLVSHLKALGKVPSELCPITEEERERFLFLDRAALYSEEAEKVLDMFKRHHEVIVDSDRSQLIDWIIQNNVRIRNELVKGA